MFKSFKYRIYPTEDQIKKINHSINVCRLVYNLALETKMWAWQSLRISLRSFDLCYQLPELKKEYKWISEVDSQSLQAEIKKIDVAYKNFFNGKGYPKFKSKRTSGSFSCPNGKRCVDWINNTLTIPKIKNINIKLSRKFEGKIKTVTISRNSTGKYFASILVEMDYIIPEKPTIKNSIGVDLGLKDFATLSTGEKIDNPKYLKNSLIRLKILQRRISRKKKGSKNRKKANLKVALLYEKITNQRKDFLHKLSHKLISDNQTDTICVETLAITNMVKNHSLALAINDAGWGEFVRQLEYKGNWRGKNIIKIDRWFASSKICSSCNYKYDELTLDQREWTCQKCNTTHDRDINAAINIRNSGMGNPIEPVELRTKVRAKKQEYMPRRDRFCILVPSPV